MDSSSNRNRGALASRPRRQTVLIAESLEGRHLLSTTAAATDTASTAAVSTTPLPSMDAAAMPYHVGHGSRSFAAHFVAHRAGRHRGTPLGLMGVGSGMTSAAPWSMTSAAPSSTATTGTPAAPTSSVAASGTASSVAPPSTTPADDPASPTSQAMPGAVQQQAGSTDQGIPSNQGGMGQGGFGFGMMSPSRGTGGGFGQGGFGFGMFNPGGPVSGMTPPAQGATGGSSATGSGSIAPPTDPVSNALQQYQTDVQSIYDKSQVTPALQAALRNDLQAINKSATTAPDPTKVLPLESDLQTLAGTLPTTAQIATLQTDFTAAVNSEGVTDPSKIAQTFTDLNALIAATNITADDVTTLTDDLKAAGLDTTSPLAPQLGVDLDLLHLAIHVQASSTSSPTGTSGTTTSPNGSTS